MEKIYRARPYQRLSTHLLTVATNIRNRINEVVWGQSPFECSGIDEIFTDLEWKEVLSDLGYLIGLTHDIGKVTPCFQLKVQSDPQFISNINIDCKSDKKLSWHTGTSALFTYFAIKNYFKAKLPKGSSKVTPDEIVKTISILGLLAVANHHARILESNIDELFRMNRSQSYFVKSVDILLKEGHKFMSELEVDHCYVEIFNETLNELQEYKKKECLNEILHKIMNIVCDTKEERIGDNSIFFLFEFLYSLLCDSDEWDAKFCNRLTGVLELPMDENRTQISQTIVDQYIENQEITVWAKKKWPKELVELRQDLYLQIAEQVNPELLGKVLTLTAPTGAGKTLAMLNFAMKLRVLYQKKNNHIPRIIYSLPFISIIDQVELLFREILDLPEVVQSEMMTVDHHLAEIQWNPLNENEEMFDYFDQRNIQDYVKLWRSDIIVTTFVKFWHTLIAGTKRKLLPQNRITGSIILLDEVQNIPCQYWDLTYQALTEMSKRYGCTVVLSSATQPLISPKKKSIELAGNLKQPNFSRYRLYYDPGAYSIDEFTRELITDIKNEEIIYKKNLMVVMNTRKNARFIYNSLKKWLQNSENNKLGTTVNLFFLSSSVLPVHRSQILKDLKVNLKDPHSIRTILVCTQVIEAGVDVSFDVIYRDFAPLDSLIQVAGRCNRHLENNYPGEVFVKIIKNENDEPYANTVYQDSTRLGATQELLKNTNNKLKTGMYSFSEKELASKGQAYFDLIKQRKITKECVEAGYNLNFKHIDENFKLIKENWEKVSLFLPWNQKGREILQKVKTQMKNPRQRKIKIDPNFYRYIINLSENDLQEIRDSFLVTIEEISQKDNVLFYAIEDISLVYDEAGLKLLL